MYTYTVYMNITLSAETELVEKARKYASERNTSLNQIIRDYLEKLVGETSNEEAAREFEAVANSMAGCSPQGWKFSRDSIHRYEDAR